MMGISPVFTLSILSLKNFRYPPSMKKSILNKKSSKQNIILFDLLITFTLTLITFVLAFIFDFSERFYQWTRVWEKYQADELFFPLLSLSLALIWFSWRRALESKSESNRNSELLAENRRLIQKLTATQEHERLYLSQELHDVFSQYLTVLRTQAEYIQTVAPAESYAIQNSIQKIVEHVEKLHSTTRVLLKTLKPTLLNFGVVMAIEDLVTEWKMTHESIMCHLEFEGLEPDLSEQELLVLYRTIQEGLSNIAQHANAKNVAVKLLFPPQDPQDKSILSLQLIDDGTVKFDSETVKFGLGLIGIRERVNALDGHFSITRLSAGTKLELTLPILQHETAE